jgi:hypothetical protein
MYVAHKGRKISSDGTKGKSIFSSGAEGSNIFSDARKEFAL